MKIYWELFYTFVKIGAFTIGGGYAMLPLIEREIVDKKKLITQEDFIDMLALAQAVPGVIAINTAIFVGYKIKGVRGSFITAIAAALPSFFIILLVAMIFTDIKDNELVQRVFKGIRPAVVALIAAPVWRMAQMVKINRKTIVIPILVALSIWALGISPVVVILITLFCSVLWGVARQAVFEKQQKK